MNSKTIKRRSCSEKLVKRTKALTNRCYNRAVEHIMTVFIMPTDYTKEDLILDMRTHKLIGFFGAENTVPNIEEVKSTVDSLYLDYICALSSQDLEDIVYVHEQDKYKRAPRTIEAILSELTRRALLEDYSEPEFKNKYKGEGASNEQKKNKKPNKAPRKTKHKNDKSR